MRRYRVWKMDLAFCRELVLTYRLNNCDRCQRAFICLTALLVLAAFSSCSKSSSNNGADHSRIKIGYYGDLSGPTFNFGESAKNGVLMAVEEANDAGGINGRRI